MILFHIGLYGPRGDLERVCTQSGGEGDVSSPLGYWKMRILPLQVLTNVGAIPEGSCVCVECAAKIRQRGRLEVARATSREIT